MVGGLTFELLTAGAAPFFWLSENPGMLVARRGTAGPVPVRGVRGGVPGLLGMSTIQVRWRSPWRGCGIGVGMRRIVVLSLDFACFWAGC
jgi:hypothetical protein